nr:hypothetical protein [Tanacetum cinerariifolium]
MSDFNELYDVKVCVRSSVKLLGEFKLLLPTNPTRERIFRRTVFGPWLNVPSYDNDNHLMHYVLHHQDHHLAQKKKNPNFNATYNLYGFAWAFKIWILETYPNSTLWWSKKKNVLPRGLAWTKISKFEKSDYDRLFGPVSIHNVDLYSTPAEKREPWFIASIPFINGLVDEDKNVSNDNAVDGQHQLGYENERVNETLVEKNDVLLLEEEDGVLDSEGGGRNHESDNVKQPANHESDNLKQAANHESDNVKHPENHESDNVKQPGNVSTAELFAEVRALRKEVALIKVDDQRIANVETLLKENLQNYFATEKTKPDMISNHTGVDQGFGGSANDPMSTCSCPDMDSAEVAYDGMSIDKADGKNEHTYSQADTSTLDVLIKAFDSSNDHPEIDVLGDVNDVDRSVPNKNHHTTPEPVHVYDFENDYINVLNDEEMVPDISLDDIKLQHKEDNLTVKERPVEHLLVGELTG